MNGVSGGEASPGDDSPAADYALNDRRLGSSPQAPAIELRCVQKGTKTPKTRGEKCGAGLVAAAMLCHVAFLRSHTSIHKEGVRGESGTAERPA